MALQGISTGTIPNDGTGDSLLAGAIKVNENFLEVYNALGDGTSLLTGNPNLTVGIITSTGLDINGNGDISGNLDVGGDLTVTGVLTYEDVTNVDSIGVVTARDGVVVLGSGITVTGVSTFYDATFLDSRLQVAGLSTFNNNVDINASVDISTDLVVDGWSNLDDVNVSAALTVTGAVDFNGDLDVDGVTTLDTTTIDELLTVNANIDANGDLDVDGHTELDFVNVSAGATIAGALDVNGGADLSGGEINLSSATVADLTDNHVVIAGSGGSLEGDANLTFNGLTLSVGVDLDVDGHTEVDNLQVVGVVTVTGSAEIDNVRIDTNTVDTTSGNLILDSTGGIVDINDAVDISGDVDIEDTTQSTSPTTGALKVAGGVGIVKNLWVDGNLDIDGTTELDTVGVTGNATITTGDLVIATAGNGIDFSATTDGTGTATSELLDNYEEGTFTPTITQGITSPTYSAQNGYYTRIGDLMFAHIILTVSGGTANGSGVIVGGLPYTSKTGGAIANVAFTGAVGIATGINAGSFGLVPSATTTIEIRYQGDQSQIAITGTELGNAVTINVSTVHRVS